MQDDAETLYTGTVQCTKQYRLKKRICEISAIRPVLSDRITYKWSLKNLN